MLNWQEIVDQGLDGMSDVELVGLLSVRTVLPMDNAAAREFLREQGLWFQAGPAAMAGAIAELESSLSANAQAVKGQMYSALWAEGTRVRCDLAEFAPAVALLVGELQALGAVSAEQVEAWYALGGGRPHADLVEADVAQARQDHADAVAQAEEAAAEAAANAELQRVVRDAWYSAYNAHISPVLDSAAPTEADLIAGVQAALSQLEA